MGEGEAWGTLNLYWSQTPKSLTTCLFKELNNQMAVFRAIMEGENAANTGNHEHWILTPTKTILKPHHLVRVSQF